MNGQAKKKAKKVNFRATNNTNKIKKWPKNYQLSLKNLFFLSVRKSSIWCKKVPKGSFKDKNFKKISP